MTYGWFCVTIVNWFLLLSLCLHSIMQLNASNEVCCVSLAYMTVYMLQCSCGCVGYVLVSVSVCVCVCACALVFQACVCVKQKEKYLSCQPVRSSGAGYHLI